MATKAERYRSAAERSGPKRAPRPKKPKPSRGTHNEAARVSAHAGYQLEAKTAAGRPSRKSTRKAANRQKEGVALGLRQSNRLGSSKSRSSAKR
jgi:hypothetical protein